MDAVCNFRNVPLEPVKLNYTDVLESQRTGLTMIEPLRECAAPANSDNIIAPCLFSLQTNLILDGSSVYELRTETRYIHKKQDSCHLLSK